MTLTWKHRVLHGTSRKSGRHIKNTVYWVNTNLVQQKNTIERNHPLRHTPSLLYPESYYDGNW